MWWTPLGSLSTQPKGGFVKHPDGGIRHVSREDRIARRRRCTRRLAAAAVVAAALGGATVPGYLAAEQARAVQGSESETGPGAEATLQATLDAADEQAAFSAGRELARLPWGEGSGSVGLREAHEGLTSGPQALAVALDGRVAVLDTINRRVVCLSADGIPEAHLALPLQEPRFLAVTNDRLYVLDADTDRTLVELDWMGRVLAEHRVPDTELPISAIFVDSGTIQIETGHNNMFELTPARSPGRAAGLQEGHAQGRPLPDPARNARGAAAGAPAARDTTGSPHPDGPPGVRRAATHARAAYGKGERPVVSLLRDDGSAAADVQIQTQTRIEHLVALAGDSHGGLILGCRLLEEHNSKTAVGQGGRPPALLLIRFQVPDDSETAFPGAGSSLLVADHAFADVGEPLVIAPSGLIYQPLAGPDGYRIIVHDINQESVETSGEEAAR
jgi:hypothetical protein